MLNFLRKIILEKQHKAKPINLKKKNLAPISPHKKYILKINKKKLKELDLQYVSYGKKNPNKFFYIIRISSIARS